MRLNSIQKGQTMFDDANGLDNIIVQKFGEISIAPTTDALRRKSALLPRRRRRIVRRRGQYTLVRAAAVAVDSWERQRHSAQRR